MTDVLVLGAGVSGLTCAVALREAGHRVRVVAAEPPSRTTSRVAGAMWGSTLAGPRGKAGRWALASLRRFRELAARPASGVALATGTLLSRSGAAPPAGLFPGVELRPVAPPRGFALAREVTLPLVDMPRLLAHLQATLEAAGVTVERRRVASLADAAGEARVVVNATGLGARELAGDRTLTAVRGQHVVVEDPGLTRFLMTEPTGPAWTGILPHGEHVVLGGVAQAGDEDREPRAADAERILEAAIALEPRLRDARVLEHQVGLRPARPEVRVEAERLGDALVVHDYGHGGCGVGLAWGCAEEVVALVARGV